MDNNEIKPDSVQELVSAESSPSASTGRRTITAILVLVAALLLGYVLYDVVLNESPAQTQIEVNYESDGYQAPEPEPEAETQEVSTEAALEITTPAEGSQEPEAAAE
jgi:hypothetical protein